LRPRDTAEENASWRKPSTGYEHFLSHLVSQGFTIANCFSFSSKDVGPQNKSAFEKQDDIIHSFHSSLS